MQIAKQRGPLVRDWLKQCRVERNPRAADCVGVEQIERGSPGRLGECWRVELGVVGPESINLRLRIGRRSLVSVGDSNKMGVILPSGCSKYAVYSPAVLPYLLIVYGLTSKPTQISPRRHCPNRGSSRNSASFRNRTHGRPKTVISVAILNRRPRRGRKTTTKARFRDVGKSATL
jgi:hypothetical protein